jgi:hypothetical protein
VVFVVELLRRAFVHIINGHTTLTVCYNTSRDTLRRRELDRSVGCRFFRTPLVAQKIEITKIDSLMWEGAWHD